MSSSRDTESAQERPIHPFETFRASMDEYEYALFESKIIRPSIRAARSHTQLFNNSVLPNLPLVFKPGRQSITDLQNFLVDTDYSRPLHNLRFPLVDPVAKMSSHIPLDRMLHVKGYFSTKQPTSFVWGEGRNFFMLRVKEVGGSLDGEVTVQRMVVSFPPSGDFHLPLFQPLAMRFFKPFLG